LKIYLIGGDALPSSATSFFPRQHENAFIECVGDPRLFQKRRGRVITTDELAVLEGSLGPESRFELAISNNAFISII
jgi:hypothetical protein